MEKRVTSYPKEVASIVRNTITMSINSELFVAEGNKGEKPLSVYGQFSRFPLTIIDRSNGNRIAKSNISTNAIPSMVARTQYAFQKQMESLYEKRSQTLANLSPAYSVTLKSGNGLKGKTPAQVIIEMGQDGVNRLYNQKIFLSNNTNPRFARDNQIQIQAIDEAMALYQNHQLNAELSNGNAGMSVEIYNAPYRANIYKPRRDGKCMVTDTKIVWNVGQEYPVEIIVSNYWASVTRNQNGAININSASIDNATKIYNHIKVSEIEWMNIMECIQRNMRQFEYINANKVFADSRNVYEQNYHNATMRQPVNTQQGTGAVGTYTYQPRNTYYINN